MTYHICIACIHIYSYILVCENYILWHFFPFFSIYADAYVNVNSLYIKFLYNFFLPDVASVSIAAFTCESFVLSMPLTHVEVDVANKVQVVLIYASCEFTTTLNLYCITILWLFYYIYYIYGIYSYIYAYMLVCYNCAVRHRYRVWNILHNVALASGFS